MSVLLTAHIKSKLFGYTYIFMECNARLKYVSIKKIFKIDISSCEIIEFKNQIGFLCDIMLKCFTCWNNNHFIICICLSVLRFIKGTFPTNYIPTIEDTYRQVSLNFWFLVPKSNFTSINNAEVIKGKCRFLQEQHTAN